MHFSENFEIKFNDYSTSSQLIMIKSERIHMIFIFIIIISLKLTAKKTCICNLLNVHGQSASYFFKSANMSCL